MPGTRTFSWPWMFSLWELHRVVGISTWEGKEQVSEAERVPQSLSPLPQVTEQGWELRAPMAAHGTIHVPWVCSEPMAQ